MIPTLLTALLAASPATSTEITVYNQGFALVKENRNLNLKAGRQTFQVEDVAQLIEPTSVAIRSITAPGSFSVLEQNYQFDLISVHAILEKAVGQKVTFTRALPNGAKEVITGTLMSSPTAIVNTGEMTYNGMVIKADDGRILLNPSGEISVDSLPDGLISKPTLLWDIDAQKAGANTVELSYLTQGISWKCDYVLALDKAGNLGDLRGWVTLDNRSGANYVNSKLKLLAGDVQRAQNQYAAPARAAEMDAMKADSGFAQEQFSDYHLYTLGRPATIKNKEIKQVSLLEAFGVKVKKELVVDAMNGYGRGFRPNEGVYGNGSFKPVINIVFQNSLENKMGMPLPMGVFKVFQTDSSGSLQMLGEDRIDHTPKNEKVTITVGTAFDVIVERKRTAFSWIRSGNDVHGSRETFEIEVRNRKETADTVSVVERFFGEYTISKNSHPFNKRDANTIVFPIQAAADSVQKVTYTVETRW